MANNNDSFMTYPPSIITSQNEIEDPPLLDELGIDPIKIKEKLI